MKPQNKLFTSFCCFILFSLTSCLQSPQPLDGYYEFAHTTGRILPTGSMNCSPAWAQMRGLCVEDHDVVNRLGIQTLKNGDLNFAMHLSFFNGDTCGLHGIAQKTEDGWLYEDNVSPETLDPMAFEDANAKETFLKASRCRLHIFVDEDIIVLNADEDAACLSHCDGPSGRFSYTHFKTTLKLQNTISDEALACINNKSDACKK